MEKSLKELVKLLTLKSKKTANQLLERLPGLLLVEHLPLVEVVEYMEEIPMDVPPEMILDQQDLHVDSTLQKGELMLSGAAHRM